MQSKLALWIFLPLVVACHSESDAQPSWQIGAGAPAPTPAKSAPNSRLQESPGPTLSREAKRFLAVEIRSSLELDLARALLTFDPPSVTEAGALAQVVKRVMVWWVDVRRDLRKGDRLDLVWEPMPDREPQLWAVWFQSQKLKTTKVAIHFKPEGQSFLRWFDPQTGSEIAKRLKNSPVRNYEQITSLLNDGRGHKGVDFKAPEGTVVYAPFSGKIGRINWSTRNNGRCIELFHSQKPWRALFLHLSSISVRPGQTVELGQEIAKVGNTGRSFAPHLHYQLEKNGRVLDPFRVQSSYRASIEEPISILQKSLHGLAQLRTSGS